MSNDRYAVAYVNFYDNENVVHVVHADTPADAMLQVISGHGGDYADWADSMIGLSVEEIQEYVWNGDAAISVPVLL